QAQVGVVNSKEQAMLRTGCEHAIRFETPLRDEIVDQDADVAVVAPRIEARFATSMLGRIDAGHESLGGRLLIARSPVELTGQIQPCDALRLQTPSEFCRLNEVVLDGIARPQHYAIFESGERANELGLDISREAHGEPVHVDLPGVDPLWLEEDLVTLLLGESRNLVLERRAIARTDPANLTVVERRPSEIRPDQLVHAISRVQEMALDLRPVDRTGHE